MKKIILFFQLLFLGLFCFGKNVDTVNIYSNAMHKQIKAVVIKPDSYKSKNKKFPVLYLLHGYSGNYSNWITKVPELKTYSNTYQMLIVCPDGDYDSWYFDSPIDSSSRYETYISKEVVSYIDSHYHSIADVAHRAITGLSMGGHGALFLAFRHTDIFGAAGSLSGGVDLNESKGKYNVAKKIGDTINYANNWQKFSVLNLIENYKNTALKIIFDCGNKDIFIKGNRRLHQKMLLLNIPHDFIERPGEHNWNYWKNSIPFQLLFFQRFFNMN
jgi:S-formylglutathione hydrolase FrmB